jgi:hypothetical protein
MGKVKELSESVVVVESFLKRLPDDHGMRTYIQDLVDCAHSVLRVLPTSLEVSQAQSRMYEMLNEISTQEWKKIEGNN